MGFQQGLSGLNASSKALDTVGNNIANSGTIGFKSGSAQFADVFAASLSGAGAAPVGIGSKVSAIVQQFSQGNISVTNNPLDTAINGGGTVTVTGYNLLRFERQTTIQYQEPAGFWHVGGLYSVQVWEA